MEKSANSGRSFYSSVGSLLLLGLPVFVLGGAAYAWYSPREYFSKTTVEVRQSAGLAVDMPVTIQDFIRTASKYTRSFEIKPIRDTDLVEIGVWDASPKRAAENANMIALEARQSLGAAGDSVAGGPAVKIWETALPAFAPARPHVQWIMACSLASGMFLAAVGVVLLAIDSRARHKRALYA